ncbi:4'-phosphopantetheinyl transferase superfamily protein [bacterium]|nr:4'-phosphopantetheinyl transferase superfamily protein [bacterium]MCB2180372.1 4'-phosphopantetheinyl transferase superfamily protein [bacterium]
MKPTTVFWTIKKAGDEFSSLRLSDLQALLSPPELQRFQEMKIPKRRQEWLLGRVTAKHLLMAAEPTFSEVPNNALTISNHPEGAPFLSSHLGTGPISITHREHIAAAAYSPSHGQVGIDLEWVESRQFSFVEDFFTPNEVSFIQRLDAGIAFQDAMVTLIWSAKEAILKVWQKGLRLDTRHIEILPEKNILYQFDFANPQQWQSLNWHTDLTGYPTCWLAWRKWGNFILTLAVSNPENAPPPAIIEIITDHTN